MMMRTLLLTVGLTSCLWSGNTTDAADFTWLGGGFGGTNNWGDPTNWTSGAGPPVDGSNTDVLMTSTAGFSDLADLFNNDLDYRINSITFEFNAYEIRGGVLTVDSQIATGVISDEQFDTHIFSNERIDLGDTLLSIISQAPTRTIRFNTPINLTQNNSEISVSGGRPVFFNNGIAAANNQITTGTLSINENTAVSISDDSSGLSQININAGKLTLNSPTFSGAISNNGNNTGLTMSGMTYSGVISGAGGVLFDGGATTILEGSNTYSGDTTISSDTTVQLSGAGRLSDSTAVSLHEGNGTLDLNGVSDTVNSIDTYSLSPQGGKVRLGGGTLTVSENSGTRQFRGQILESGTFRKNGGGTLKLIGDNSFTNLEMNAGRLELSGLNTFVLDINGGTVQFGDQQSLGIGAIELGDGTLEATAGLTNSLPIITSGSLATIDINQPFPNDSLTQAGVINGTGSLTKSGIGFLILSGNNTYAGSTFINEGRLTVDSADGIPDSSDVVIASGATLRLAANETIDSLSGNGSVELRENRLTVDQDGDTVIFNGRISSNGSFAGGGGITKEGTHVMVLSGLTNFYDDATIINEGTLRIGVDRNIIPDASELSVHGSGIFDLNGFDEAVSALAGSGSVTLGGGTLTTDKDGGVSTFSGAISETGEFVKAGTSTLKLTGNNTFLGGVTVSGGVLEFGPTSDVLNDNNAVTVESSGTLRTQFPETIGSLAGAGNVVLNIGFLDVGTNHASTTYSGVISGLDRFVKSGTGTFTTSGTHTYSSSTTINGGTWRMIAGGLQNTSNVVIAAGATFDQDGGAVTTTHFSKDAAGTFDFDGGSFTLDGGDAVFNSSFAYEGPQADTPTFTVTNGGDAVVTASWQVGDAAGGHGITHVSGTNLDGSRRSTLRGLSSTGDLRVGDAGSGTLLVDNGGLVALGDDTEIARGTTASVGLVTVSGVANVGGNLIRSEVDATGNGAGSFFNVGRAGSGILNIVNGALVRVGASLSLGNLAGSVGEVNMGGMSEGFPAELIVQSNVSVGAGGASTFNLNDGAQVTADQLTVFAGSSVNFAGGELSLDTLDLITGGGFHMTGGVLHAATVDGNLAPTGGTVAPGSSPGITSVTGNFKPGSGASLEIEIGDSLPGSGFDQLNVAGAATLNGMLSVTLIDLGGGVYMPSVGETFTVLTSPALGGGFSNIASGGRLDTTDGLGSFLVDYSSATDTVVLSQFLALLAGDFDIDGDVDGFDFLVWQRGGSPQPLSQTDLADWQQNYGVPTPFSTSSTGVPEPASLALLLSLAAISACSSRQI